MPTKPKQHFDPKALSLKLPMTLLCRVGEHAEEDIAAAVGGKPGTPGERPITRDGFSSRVLKDDDPKAHVSSDIQPDRNPEEKEEENILGGSSQIIIVQYSSLVLLQYRLQNTNRC